jgi:diguanylate cyclase (GGDEF)-like protein/PAS domain S-box-containing protein
LVTAPGVMRGLQARLILSVLAGASLFALLAGALAYGQAQEGALAASRETMQGLARTIEKTVAVGAFARDPVLLRELVSGLSSHSMVAGAAVTGIGGDVLATAGRGATLQDVGRDAGMSIIKPLVSPFDGGESVGTLLIWADDAGIRAAARHEAYRSAALMAGQAVLLAALLYLVAARLVSRPIVRMAQQFHSMAPGTSLRLEQLPQHAHDEIGMLVEGANALLEANAVALRHERELRAEIEALEAQYRQIFDSSSAGIFVLDEDGRFINGNPTVSKVVGLSLRDMGKLKHESFVRRVFGDPALVESMIRQAREQRETISGDLELVRLGQGRRWVHCLISVQGAPQGKVERQRSLVEGVIYDITERKIDEVAAKHRAEHDPLTGLKNRAGVELTLDRWIAETLVDGSMMSVLCIDLDGFKQVNDRFGHPAGDQVLKVCAQRMKAAVRRSSDLIGRVGGDEFIVGLRGVGPSDPMMTEAASALLQAIGQGIVLDTGDEVHVGASIGVACVPLHGNDRGTVIQAADEALYHVKHSGKRAVAIACLRPQSTPAD